MVHEVRADPLPDLDITPRVLIVDDDRQLAGFLRELLELHGARTEVAHGGQEARRQVTAFHPDVLLLDLLMPDIDGFAVCRQLRAERARDVRVVAMTGYYSAEYAQRIVAAGADACLAKPLDRERLLKCLGLPTCTPPAP